MSVIEDIYSKLNSEHEREEWEKLRFKNIDNEKDAQQFLLSIFVMSNYYF